ncbi:DUF5425 family lipoprotein [Borreliella turdi]|nr:DUF5425 family lipoprotein [Borreliella turdi]
MKNYQARLGVNNNRNHFYYSRVSNFKLQCKASLSYKKNN